MIGNDLAQAAIIAWLKANTTLITWLTARSAQSEIRESQWQGRDFVYPAVRVDLGTQTEIGDPPCGSQIPLSVYSFTEGDSSQEADILARLVDQALLRSKPIISTVGYTSGLVVSDGLVGAIRTSERVWRAVGQYRWSIYGGVS